jgi:hypothetical protein
MIFSRYLSLATAIALTGWGTLNGEAIANPPVAKGVTIQVICDTTSNPPLTVLKRGTEMVPLLSWYDNYLMPQDSAVERCQSVAKKLQAKYQQSQPALLAYQQVKNEWQVCLVSQTGDDCTAANSEMLFSLNAAFKAPECVMEGISPQRCPVNLVTRGPVIRVPGGTYKPSWWVFLFP